MIEERDKQMDGASKDKFTRLREMAETLVSQTDPDISGVQADDVNALLHELQVYQAELEIQNEELRKAQNQLEIARNRYANLYHHAPIGYLLVDQNGIIQKANETFHEMLGMNEAESDQKPFSDFISPTDRGIFQGRFRSFFKDPKEKSIELRIITQTREIKHVNIVGRTMEAEMVDQSAAVVLLTVTDITPRVMAEERIKHLNEVLKAIRQVNQMIVLSKDPETLLAETCRILTTNRGYWNAWIVTFQDDYQTVHTYQMGMGEEFAALQHQLQQGHYPQCISGALEKEGVYTIGRPPMDCPDCPMAPKYENRGGMAVRLESNGFIFGVLCVSIPKYYTIDPEEHHLFEELARDVAFALYSLKMEQEREAFQKEIHLHHQILNTTQSPMSFVDNNYVYKAVNRAYADYFNAQSDRLVGQSVQDCLGEEIFHSQVKPRIDRCLQGETITYELWVDFPGKGQRYMVMKYHPFKDMGERIVGIVAHGTDITDIKLAERKLHQSEERFRILVENMPLLVNAVTQDGSFSYWNQECEKVTGYLKEEMIANPNAMSILYPIPEIQERLQREWEEANYQFKNKEIPLQCKNGQQRLIQWTNLPREFATEDGGVWALGVDVTEQKRAENLLRESKENLATTLNSIGDAVIATDALGYVVEMNPVAETLTGWKKEEALHKPLEDIFTILHAKHRTKIENPVAQVLQQGITLGLANHTMLVSRQGEERQIADSAAPIQKNDGEIIGSVLVFRDVTDDYSIQEKIRFQAMMLNQIHDVVTATDTAGKIVYVNQACCDSLKEKPDELIGRPIECLGEEPARGTTQRDILETAQREGSWRGEVVNYARDGEEIILDCRVRKIFDEDGATIGFCGISTNITERKRHEIELQKSNQRVTNILESISDGFFVLDRDMAVNFFNPAAEAILNRKKEHLMGRNLFEVFPEAKGSIFEIKYSQALRERIPLSFEAYFSPYQTWYDVRVYPNDDGISVYFQDTTERKQALIQLEEQKRLQQIILDGLPDVISLQKPDHTIITYNKAGYELLELSPEEVNGKKCYELVGRSYACDECVSRKAQATGTIQKVERYMPELNRWIETWANPVFDEHGKITMVVEQIRDITTRVKLENQLRQSQKMEAVGQLAGGVAHDFNNLLTAIIGYTSLIQEDITEHDEFYDEIEQIANAADRAKSLTQQLLAFSRKQILQPRILDLNALIHDLDKMLKRLIGENIEYNTHFDPDLGTVKADPGQIEQVILNLAVNARDAMPNAGSLSITTRNITIKEPIPQKRKGIKPGAYAMVRIQDSGTGIKKEHLSKIFEPFFTTKDKNKGTGLGLSTVYGIIKQSNGFVFVDSEEGKGSTFDILLPRIETTEIDPRNGNENGQLSPGARTVRILLVEDEENVRTLIKTALERHGHEVLIAQDGVSAKELFDSQCGSIDLLITDVVMPKMSGKELYIHCKSSQEKLKALFISGYSENAIDRHGVLEEGLDFLPKPFSPNRILKKIDDILGRD